jgi:hypothetical protein
MAERHSMARLSLTKAQLQTAAGAELLALCQSVTEDGSLAKEEIVGIRDWLVRNRDLDLPAIQFLFETLKRILADGVVTKEERTELYKAIETVLPPEARKMAKEQRQEVEAIRRAFTMPLCSANFMVAGVFYEGRDAIIERFLQEGDPVFLIRDRGNRYSRNAIAIRLANGLQIGFAPEEDAIDLAPYLDQGHWHRAYCTKILTGGRCPIPVVKAHIHRADARVDGTVAEDQVPGPRY